jgi:hypothetical protein
LTNLPFSPLLAPREGSSPFGMVPFFMARSLNLHLLWCISNLLHMSLDSVGIFSTSMALVPEILVKFLFNG